MIANRAQIHITADIPVRKSSKPDPKSIIADEPVGAVVVELVKSAVTVLIDCVR